MIWGSENILSASALQSGGVEVGSSQEGSVIDQTITAPEWNLDFTWRMEDRFGLDRNQDGRIDVPNTMEYIQNSHVSCAGKNTCQQPAFIVHFKANLIKPNFPQQQQNPAPPTIKTYNWDLRGPGMNKQLTTHTPEFHISLIEGTYMVTLQAIWEGPASEVRRVFQHSITVKDIVFLAIGDSFSSGEGNPEDSSLRVVGPRHSNTIPKWADAGTSWEASQIEDQAHTQAHRTTLAWPAQAALVLERSDPHTSVTFVFLAATGSTILKGLFGPHVGAQQHAPTTLPPQLEEATRILGRRQVDILTMSIGGNDVGFANVITSLLKSRGRDRELARRTEAIRTGIWDGILWGRLWGGGGIFGDREKVNVPGLAQLPALFSKLNDTLRTGLKPKYVYILTYPDLTQYLKNGNLATCDHLGGDVLKIRFAREIDREEARWAREQFLQPVNRAIKVAALQYGWIIIEDNQNWFHQHGYCGKPAYVPSSYLGNKFITTGIYPLPSQALAQILPTDKRWIRTATESVVIQGIPQSEEIGITPDTVESTGMFHPNELGHQVLMHLLYPHLVW